MRRPWLFVLILSTLLVSAGARAADGQLPGDEESRWGLRVGLAADPDQVVAGAQFFETRYSKNFRVFAGMIAFLSGLINFGIFPAVGARFFIYFCGLPQALSVFGLAVPTFPLVMIALLGIALFFVFSGGQVAVIITDFAQSMFVNVVFVAIVLYLFVQVDWTQIVEALSMAPENASLINPFKTSHVEDFNFWYFLIGVVGVLYGAMSWQGTQAYNSSAKSAHEAKMGGVLGNWRGFPQGLFLLFVPIIRTATFGLIPSTSP